MSKIMDTGEVARRSGLSVATLRFYEQKGLIESVGRKGLRRQFDSAVLERLALITLGRSAGFSLDEIVRMFAVSPVLEVDRAYLLHKADELDKMIRQMRAIRDGLRHVAECPAENHFECPRFRQLLRLAVRNQQRKRKTASKSKPV